jgi:carboxyl-terminal processing protease
MKKLNNNVLIALLGVVLGVLLTLVVFKILPEKKFDGDYNRWRKLNLILQEVQKNYVDTIDMKVMTDAAVTAALAELDPHSVYLPPVELTESESELAGNFEGIGITFNVPNDTVVVLNTIPGGPSEKAGLVQGDRVIRVDERVIAGVKMPQDSMIRLMKGPSGTKVKITVKRGSEIIPFDIVRDKIPVHCVDAAFMIDGTTGYIKLSKFTRTTYKEFRDATSKLLGQGMKKLVFDLHNYLSDEIIEAYLKTEKEIQNIKAEDYRTDPQKIANGSSTLALAQKQADGENLSEK